MPTVFSRDRTKIAYDKVGKGRALVLVQGALGMRASFAPLAALLAPTFRVYTYDRRGRGDSTDTPPYSVRKEIEDLEAVIAAIDGPVNLFGISSGGALALEAALALGDRVKKLAVYEVPYDSSEAGIQAWREYFAKLKAFLAAGRRSDALALFLGFVGAPEGMIEGMRRAPAWKAMEALGPTLAYDAAILGESRAVPAARFASITAPTLVLDGSGSLAGMPFMRASAEALARAIPGARHRVLEGQRHDVDPKALAPVLADFFGKTG